MLAIHRLFCQRFILLENRHLYASTSICTHVCVNLSLAGTDCQFLLSVEETMLGPLRKANVIDISVKGSMPL